MLFTTTCKSDLANKHFQKSLQYRDQENYNQAIEELNKVIELNPNFELAYLGRGHYKTYIGDHEGALKI